MDFLLGKVFKMIVFVSLYELVSFLINKLNNKKVVTKRDRLVSYSVALGLI